MYSLKKYLRPELIVILFLIISSSYLRLKNLGYSDYIGDEHKAFLIPNGKQTSWNFLISQRKGPMQFLISYIPYLITNDFRNELAERIPFSFISIISVLVFYLFVKKLTKNTIISFTSTFLFSVSGFIVGFGRIAQYQNLNLLFSFLSLYFYSDLIFKKKHLIRSTLLGTLFWCLSILSHWDAVFIIPLVVWFFLVFLRNSNFTKEYKIRIIIYNFILGCLFLLPFMVPYILYHRSNDPSSAYFLRRVGFGYSNGKLYRMFIDLYNPFLTFWLISFFGLLGVARVKKSYLFSIWFLFGYLILEIFVRKPGTHIYNFLIPAFILCGFGIDFLFRISPKVIKVLFSLFTITTFAFLYFQSYMIFVDSGKEYPWEQEKILSVNIKRAPIANFLPLKTEKYYYDYEGQKLPLFGFPHKRYWKQVNDYINEQNVLNGENLGYSTNEDQTVSRYYMDASYKSMGTFYFVGIRNPVNFVTDMNPPHIGESELIKTLTSEDDTNQVEIYRVTVKKD